MRPRIDLKKLLLYLIGTFTLICLLFVFHGTASVTSSNKISQSKLNIGIINILEPNSAHKYLRAMDSVKCYAQVQGYTNLVLNAADFAKECPHKDKFFRRHCVTAQFLPRFDYLLLIDGDIGVANPKRRIEEYIHPDFDVTFYDRFMNPEIVAGSSLLKNTPYALDFLKGFADYEYKLPHSFHGTDNGALHLYVASKIFGNRPEEYNYCVQVYNKSGGYDDLFTYTSCIRAILGISEKFPHIRILRKGTGWARDSYVTNSVWDPVNDFMFHGWQIQRRGTYKLSDLPWKLQFGQVFAQWIDPIVGEFDFDKCIPGNYSWVYDKNLLSNTSEVQKSLEESRAMLRKDYYRYLARLPKLLNF